MTSDLPFIRPFFPRPEELATDFEAIVESNWFTNFGPQERRLAAAIEEYVGGGVQAATFANGTLALVAALQAALPEERRGSYVLMPAFTFVAVAQCAVWTGFRPLFVDVDPVTWQPSLASARETMDAFRGEVAGILLANTFGVGNPDIGAWERFAAEWELPLVIDSAAGFGSRYADGDRVGTRGVCEIFSFHATKPFAVGEGGALVSRSPDVTEAVTRFQNFGFSDDRDSTMLGLNAKLQELNAAIGLRSLPGLDERIRSRRRVLEQYQRGLAGSGFGFQPNAESSSLCFAAVTALDVGHKEEVLKRLTADRVGVRDYYNPPLHRHRYFVERGLVPATGLPVTEDLCARIISLPVHDHMTDLEVARVVDGARGGLLDA